MAATMTVTASLQWLCALSLAWLVATAGAASLSTTDVEGALYHMLRRFHLRMIEGLALPLYGFPTLAFFLGFVVLAPRTWARLALTLTGVAAWPGRPGGCGTTSVVAADRHLHRHRLPDPVDPRCHPVVSAADGGPLTRGERLG